jgi:tRNA-2-methylthio-N6-dimethylallyladenosine synthase
MMAQYTMNPKQYYHLHTIGCQMNVYDSQRMGHLLATMGLEATERPEKADVIVVNTCSVRAKAEQKLYSLLGRLARFKQANPQMTLAVGGCVAQQEGRRLLQRVPQLDLVFGPNAVSRLPELMRQVPRHKRRIVDTSLEPVPIEAMAPHGGKTPATVEVSRFVTIMTGCDNFCSYCVVPHVRGRENSRPPRQIVDEITRMVAAGTREVTLLGQNVNSYGLKNGLCSFAELLEMVNDIKGLRRIRFTTSHPKDLSSTLIESFRSLDKLCPHIHLPVQSGADRVLKRMNRRYSRAQYIDKVERLRAVCPSVAITTDFIVGFPGETEAEFEATLSLMREVGFDAVFAFKYSDRPHTAALHFKHKVPRDEKDRRLQTLLSVQKAITLRKHACLVGTDQMVLVERRSKMSHADEVQWSGRTPTHQIVNFGVTTPLTANGDLTGRLVGVTIDQALPHCLTGVAQVVIPDGAPLKGVDCCAA